MMRRLALRLTFFILTIVTGACGSNIDLSTALQIDGVSTGWLDAGIVDGKNKLVPAVSFKLKNVSG